MKRTALWLMALSMISGIAFSGDFQAACPGSGISRVECLERLLLKRTRHMEGLLEQALKEVDINDKALSPQEQVPPAERQKWKQALTRSHALWREQTKIECNEIMGFNWWGVMSGTRISSEMLQCELHKTEFRIREISQRLGQDGCR